MAGITQISGNPQLHGTSHPYSAPQIPGIHIFLNCPLLWTEESKLSLASYVFALSKTQNIKLVTVFCDMDSLPQLDKIPRSIRVQTKPRPTKQNNFMKMVVELCTGVAPTEIVPISSDVLLVVQDLHDFVVPESIQACGQSMRSIDYSFLLEKSDASAAIKVQFLDIRHWMIGVQMSYHHSPFMAKCSVFLQDAEDFVQEPTEILFDVLSIMKKRILGCPIPSLSMDLRNPKSPPPIVPWKQIHELIKSAIF